jgi:hypothetical protein
LHDQCAVHAGRCRSAGCDVEHCRQCDGKSADGGVERDRCDFVGDHYGGAGRIYDGDDGVRRDGVLRVADNGSAGSEGDGAAGMRSEFGVDHMQGDTGDGDVERVVGRGGVCDTDVLSGGDDCYRICAACGRNRRRGRRRDWIVAGDDDGGLGRIGLDVPAEPPGGFDVCCFVAGGVGVGGLQ